MLCGEDEKQGWGLLKSTLPDLNLSKQLAFRTDLHDQAGGVSWESTIRGFLYNDHFLIMKTFPDKSPFVRKGRAFSHVLVVSKEHLELLTEIAFILNLLPRQINKSALIDPITIKIQVNNNKHPKGFQNRFNKAINGFANANNYNNTIVWIGDENYEIAISKFWQFLTSKEKEQLNFGIYFNVDAIPNEKLNFITIPENIESKFVNRGFCTIRKTDAYNLTEISEQLLAGDSNARERISKFQSAIEASNFSREAIYKVAIVLNTFETIDSINDLKKINTLSHVIAQYSPDRSKGVRFKEILINKICNLTESCDVSDLHLIKTFKIGSFSDGEGLLRRSVSNWLTSFLFSKDKTDSINFGLLFKQLQDIKIRNWWSDEIEDKLRVFLIKSNINNVSVIYDWINFDISILEYIQSFIDISKESETYFLAQLDKGNKVHFKSLLAFSLEKKWLRFHAKLMILEFPFEKAITQQLLVDNQQDHNDGLIIITEKTEPGNIIQFSINNEDDRLMNICGELCVVNPFLFENIDVTNYNWQKIWLNAINQGNHLTDGILSPKETIFKFFDTIIDNNKYNEDLLKILSESEYGNILHYPKRSNLWSRLPSFIKKNFLDKTSSSLLEKLSNGSAYKVPEDSELSEHILSNGISDFLYFNRNNIKATLPIFNTFNQLSESLLKDYISNYSAPIDVIEATQVGKLVLSRNFSSVASVINKKSTHSNNWEYALAECHLLLDFFSKAKLSISGRLSSVIITSEQWWQGAEDIIVDLYSNGNSIHTIWKKSGGKESDILVYGTAQDLWRDLLSRIRKGEFGHIAMNSLLKEIDKQYSSTNNRFKLLFDLRKKYISTE